MALVRGGLRDATPLAPGDGSIPGLVAWGHQWAAWQGFELSDEVAGEIGFLFWHAGARTNAKDRDADHLVQHARERGHEVKKQVSRTEEAPSEEAPTDDERSAWVRALEVEGLGVTEKEFMRAHPETAAQHVARVAEERERAEPRTVSTLVPRRRTSRP
jgi:hypothetical protein